MHSSKSSLGSNGVSLATFLFTMSAEGPNIVKVYTATLSLCWRWTSHHVLSRWQSFISLFLPFSDLSFPPNSLVKCISTRADWKQTWLSDRIDAKTWMLKTPQTLFTEVGETRLALAGSFLSTGRFCNSGRCYGGCWARTAIICLTSLELCKL